jgi:hypothetical protein
MAENEPVNPIADVASLGGIARKNSLSAEERQAIARQAVEARWEKAGKLKKVAKAAYGSADHPLRIGQIEIPCYVLDDERRVLVQSGMIGALDMSQGTAGRGEGDRLGRFLATKAVNPFVTPHLREMITHPIKFKLGGTIAYGYEATILADLCEAVLEARLKGKLNYQQEHIAKRCEILVRGFMRVGIVALVDEATGFQDERARDSLAKILEEFVAKELQKWVSTFSADYYKQLFRLWGVPFNGSLKRPQFFGTLTNNIVYSRLAPGVLQALREKNPMTGKGYRQHKHFQWLTDDAGYLALKEHLSAVTALMKASPDKDAFLKMLDVALPKYKELPLLEMAPS